MPRVAAVPNRAILGAILILSACSTAPEPLVVQADEPVEVEIPIALVPETPACALGTDAHAIRVAALQQRLIVAGYVCDAADSYNEFVLAYQGDLRESDIELLTFFDRMKGDPGGRTYDSFKTELANNSMLESASNLDTYCAHAGQVFVAGISVPGKSLKTFVSETVTPADSVLACGLIGEVSSIGTAAQDPRP